MHLWVVRCIRSSYLCVAGVWSSKVKLEVEAAFEVLEGCVFQARPGVGISRGRYEFQAKA